MLATHGVAAVAASRYRGGVLLGGNEMEKINPFVGLFVAIAALNAGMFVWLRADIAEVRGEIAAVRGEIAEARGEIAGNSERLARIEAGLADLRDGLSVTNERMARIEGTVAGALGRPFPERMARAPDAEDASGG